MKHIYIALFELSQNSREYIQLDLTQKNKQLGGNGTQHLINKANTTK